MLSHFLYLNYFVCFLCFVFYFVLFVCFYIFSTSKSTTVYLYFSRIYECYSIFNIHFLPFLGLKFKDCFMEQMWSLGVLIVEHLNLIGSFPSTLEKIIECMSQLH